MHQREPCTVGERPKRLLLGLVLNSGKRNTIAVCHGGIAVRKFGVYARVCGETEREAADGNKSSLTFPGFEIFFL